MQDLEEQVGLSATEQAFFKALRASNVPFIIVGLSAARLQGACLVTEDIDLWFPPGTEDAIAAAAVASGVVYVPAGRSMNPPQFGGRYVRFDQVLTLSGISDFATESKNTITVEINQIPVRVLHLSRIIESKRAANRPKDRAVLPALEAALLALSAT